MSQPPTRQELRDSVWEQFYPPRGRGVVLTPESEVLDLPSDDSPDAALLAVRGAGNVLGRSAVFNDSLLTTGETEFVVATADDPEAAPSLVAGIVALWRAIHAGHQLALAGEPAVTRARASAGWRQVEHAGRCYASACEAVRNLAAADLAAAWGIADPERALQRGDPLPPFVVDHWYDALPELCRHFSARGPGWCEAGWQSPLGVALRQESTLWPGIVAIKSPPTNQGARKKRLPDASTDARDKWLYEQRCEGTADKVILAELHRRCARERWEDIETVQGVRNRAADYASRNSLPKPAPRREQ
jgi:hypothetical protein